MNKNKKYSVLPEKSQNLSMSNYTIEFGYSHRNHKKSHRGMASNSSEAQIGSMRKMGEKQKEDEFIPDKSNQNQYKKFKINSVLRFDTEPCHPVLKPKMGSGFPCRKVKTNEHQLFKILAKFQYHNQKKKRTQQFLSRKQSASPTNKKCTHVKNRPHLHNWMKQRYCVNRDRDNGFFPFSIDVDKAGSRVTVKSPLGQ